jgi:hypothetical protein
MTTKIKTTTTRKKATPKPKTEATTPAAIEEQVDQPVESVPTCPECGAPMVRRSGRFGEFFGCSNFKSGECKATIKIEQ